MESVFVIRSVALIQQVSDSLQTGARIILSVPGKTIDRAVHSFGLIQLHSTYLFFNTLIYLLDYFRVLTGMFVRILYCI
jgi:hypothetical protein